MSIDEIVNEVKPKIEFKNVTYEYNKGTAFSKKALDDVSFSINAGEFVGLIGHTGSGKSTLIQHINALIKPTSGTVFVDGQDVNANKEMLKSIRQKCGLVFQYPEHQLFDVTVVKDVAFGPTNMGLSKDEIDERVAHALDIMGVPQDVFEKSPFELSGGQKRRVAIAGVLAMRPEVLILDEPTAGLDPRGRDELLENLRSMHETLGITVILVSHSMEDIAKLAGRIIVMDRGKIVMNDCPQAVFAQHQHLAQIGLSAPGLTLLMYELKQKGFDVSENIFTTEQATDEIYKLLKRGAK